MHFSKQLTVSPDFPEGATSLQHSLQKVETYSPTSGRLFPEEDIATLFG